MKISLYTWADEYARDMWLDYKTHSHTKVMTSLSQLNNFTPSLEFLWPNSVLVDLEISKGGKTFEQENPHVFIICYHFETIEEKVSLNDTSVKHWQ